MKTEKNKFSWLFLVAGILILFVVIVELILPHVEVALEIDYRGFGYLGFGYSEFDYLKVDYLEIKWGVADFLNVFNILLGLFGIFAFFFFAVTLIVNAFRRLRFLLIISTWIVNLHSNGVLGYQLLRLVAKQDPYRWAMYYDEKFYRDIPLADGILQSLPLLSSLAFGALFFIAVFYTIPSTRRAACAWSRVPVVIVLCTFLLLFVLTLASFPIDLISHGAEKILNLLLSCLLTIFLNIPSLSLALSLWFLRWGIRRDCTDV